jgi:hypothetical protein
MMNNVIFVFGSNLSGYHGKGAALAAKNLWGAVEGVGIGRTGDSYALPTKDKYLKVLPLNTIELYVRDFIQYAKTHPDLLFYVTAIGTGYAGYKITEIKELFGDFNKLPYNIVFTKDWI